MIARIIDVVGRGVSWLTLVMTLLIFAVVVLRWIGDVRTVVLAVAVYYRPTGRGIAGNYYLPSDSVAWVLCC